MKKIFSFSAFWAAIMLLFPLSVFEMKGDKVAATSDNLPVLSEEVVREESFKVLIDGKITELSADEYICGVVAAEMPALYHEEALKAQAVAAYTFACKRKSENKDKDYDITADHTVDQSYISREELTTKWGDKADEYMGKIESAVNQTKNLLITYNGKPITAVYHAVSSGLTEDCKNVWGKEIAYLKPVVSEGDKLCANYISKASFTAEELKSKLKNTVELSGEPSNYLGKSKSTKSGTVTEITVCNKPISGFTLQKLLDLKSANFKVTFADDKFTFTVYGYGHGVGMSQNGANYMAKQGCDFKEILSHYYKGCEIEGIE